jgi:1-acyl-sn-glycerol-3-phosphate acyltransferase
MDLVGLIRYRPHLDLSFRRGPRVIVANHPTLVDVTAILAAYPEACCLVKSTIYRNPLFLPIMKFCGHIEVDRGGAPSGGPGAIHHAAERLAEGSDVLMFPEGTRSPTSLPGDFRAGAFALAVHSEVDLHAVAISCSRAVLKRDTPWYLIPPEPVVLMLHSLGTVTPLPGEPVLRLRDRVQGLYRATLK